MLNLELVTAGGATTVTMDGVLDANSADSFQEKLNEIPADSTSVTIDMEKLKYTSSAGLRVILALQNRMMQAGANLTFVHVNDEIKEVFDDTGFSDFLNIE